jgi:hypothetical protein
MDNFFQNINKRLTDIGANTKLTEGAVTERDMGKHNNANTGFDALAKKAGAKYGSKAAGKRVAGAQFQKMKKAGQLEEGQCSSCNCSPCKCDSMEESAFQAAIGKKKYGDQGMKALQKAGREHAGAKTMSNIRNKYNKYDEADNMSLEEQDMEEGNEFSGARQAAIKAGKSTFSVGGKTYRVTGDTSNEKQMKEGAFKKIDIERQEKAEKARHSPNKGALNQVPGMQNLKPHAKEHPLKNVARGIKAFVKGEPEPMDEAFTFNVKKGRWEWDDGTSYSMSELTPAQKERVKQWKLENPGKRPGRPPANTDRQPNNYGTRGFREQAMDEAKKSKPDYPDIDKDGDRKESMKKAADDKKGQSTAGTVFDPEYRARMKKDKEGTGNFDKKSTSTGTVHTRRHREDDEEEVKSDEPKRKGRPKGPAKAPERVTAKSYKYKSGRPVKENEIGIMNRGEYDQEGAEAKGDMHTIMRHARELETHLQDSENLPTWVIEKIGQIKGMMTSVSDYILSQQEHGTEHDTDQQGIVLVPEKAVSVAQRRAAGIARGAQKGEIPKNTLRGASKQMSRMPKGELRKFAATKEKGLPKHAESESADKPKKVKETTTSGSVAPAPNDAPKGSGKMSFGKGVYEGAISESYERKLSGVLAEGMTMSVNMGTKGQRSISVNADGEDAEKLAEILKLAGLGNASHGDMTPGCDSCGQASCGCDTVDESYGDSAVTDNMPDWPTDPETTDDNDPYLRRLSGGLNGPKSTGQTTTPVIAGQLRRTSTMEQTVKLEQDLHRLYKSYKPR